MRRRVWFIGLAVVVFVLAAAGSWLLMSGSDYQYRLTNVTGAQPDLELFGAQGTDGEPRSAADYSGDVVVLYFGYTHCPNICPTTLAKFHAVMEKLGKKAASKVQFLLVTVDPERDTKRVLKQYVRSFDERFRALRLTGKPLQKLEDRYHMSVQLGEPDANGDYQVNHSAGMFVFDGDGDMRLIGSRNKPLSAWAADLRHLVTGL